MYRIPYVSQVASDQALPYIQEAIHSGVTHGDGAFTRKCHDLLQHKAAAQKILLTSSGTAALEMAALLSNLKSGDEVIMPSFTFSSTANAVVLRGAVPVFIDIRQDTFNIDESLIEAAITPKTKAILPVHYAGVSAEMDTISAIAHQHHLMVIEDAAQGVGATYKGRALGTLGDFGAYSFHGTKNIFCGEGGALLINSSKHNDFAEIIREKGTNRTQFIKGEVDKYTWHEVGSSYLPSELTAAFLLAQLEDMDEMNQARLNVWETYHKSLAPLEEAGFLTRPDVPSECVHNGHIYGILVEKDADALIDWMKRSGIQCVRHYIPLHDSPAGQKYGRFVGKMEVTDHVAHSIVRLPLWKGLTHKQVEEIVERIDSFFRKKIA